MLANAVDLTMEWIGGRYDFWQKQSWKQIDSPRVRSQLNVEGDTEDSNFWKSCMIRYHLLVVLCNFVAPCPQFSPCFASQDYCTCAQEHIQLLQSIVTSIYEFREIENSIFCSA